MRSIRWLFLFAALSVSGHEAIANDPDGRSEGSSRFWEEPRLVRMQPSFFESMYVVRYELMGIHAVITGIGLANWNWGSSNSFVVNDEGWFSKSTGSGGMDKLGHGYAAYAISEGLRYQMLNSKYSYDRLTASIHASIFSAFFMTYIEIFDGYSGDHGFAKEDMVANMTGIGFSFLRGVFPGLEKVLDYRMQYWPEDFSDIRPLSDYEGQNFRLVLKPAGFNVFRDSTLRFLEFHVGYKARGFDKSQGYTQADRKREIFVGLGLNFDALFFDSRRAQAGWLETTTSNFLRYFQPAWTTLDTGVWKD